MIISKIESTYWQHNHKSGISLPDSIDEALGIYLENNNDYWRKDHEPEMRRVDDAFC